MAAILHRMSLSAAVYQVGMATIASSLFVLKRGIQLARLIVLRLFSTLFIDFS